MYPQICLVRFLTLGWDEKNWTRHLIRRRFFALTAPHVGLSVSNCPYASISACDSTETGPDNQAPLPFVGRATPTGRSCGPSVSALQTHDPH